MKRVIVDYKNISPELLKTLSYMYPDGYEDADSIRFTNSKGEIIKALEVRTTDVIYLVKISVQLQETLEEMDYDDDDEIEPFELEEDPDLSAEDDD